MASLHSDPYANADGRVELLEPDEVLVHETHLVAVAYMVVVMSPRAVVVARLLRADVVSVIEL